MLLLLEVDNPVGDVEVFAKAPLVAIAQDGGDSGGQVVVDVSGSDVGKWFKKFGGLPGVQGAGEILARAKQPELLELMIGMVEQCVFAQMFLELAKQASRKSRLLFEVYVMEAPLVLKERL